MSEGLIPEVPCGGAATAGPIAEGRMRTRPSSRSGHPGRPALPTRHRKPADTDPNLPPLADRGEPQLGQPTTEVASTPSPGGHGCGGGPVVAVGHARGRHGRPPPRGLVNRFWRTVDPAVASSRPVTYP